MQVSRFHVSRSLRRLLKFQIAWSARRLALRARSLISCVHQIWGGPTITICSGSNINDCEVLAHELTHISQYCAMGLFSLQSVSCDQFEAIRRDPRNAICRELEAYRTAGQCDDNPATPLSDCCNRACGSASRYWQGSVVNCQNCCKELSDRRCCDHGVNECEHPVACVGGGSHAP